MFPHDGYYNTRALADKLRPHGAVAVAVDQLDLDVVEVALRAGPAVLWAETPTNPLLRVADLAALGALAAAAGAPFVVDNTVATGLLQKPLDFGAVASVYSLTKSISGHSDVLGGAVVTRDAELAESVRGWRTAGGAIPGPFESWLVLRGMKTLPLRIARQSENALAIAQFLAAPPAGDRGALPGAGPVGGGVAADAARLRAAALVRAGRDGGRRRRGGRGRPAGRARHQLRRRRVDLGAARAVGGRDGAGDADPAVGRASSPPPT